MKERNKTMTMNINRLYVLELASGEVFYFKSEQDRAYNFNMMDYFQQKKSKEYEIALPTHAQDKVMTIA